MRRVYLYFIMALSIASFVSCTTGYTDMRNPERLAVTIWNEAHSDIRYLNNILIDVVHFDNMLKIEDDSLRHRYFEAYFGERSTLINQKDGYMVQTKTFVDTYMNTFYTTNGVALGEGEWHVRYTGGNNYKVTLTPLSDGRIKVMMSNCHNAESIGSAEITFDYELSELDERNNAEATILYDGFIEMVDYSSSSMKPLTLRSETLSTVELSDQWGCKYGEFKVSCHDEYYNSYDEITVEIDFDPQRHVIVHNSIGYEYFGRIGI